MGRRAIYNKETAEPKDNLFDDEELFESPTHVAEEAPVEQKSSTSVKEFNDTDRIPCVSITVGGLSMVGAKSGEFYRWMNMGDVVEVEYRDLVSAIREHTKDVFEPRFIIQDDDFLAKYDTVQLRYGQLYTPADIEQVLAMPATQMEAMIKKMPVGAQNAVRDLASRKVDSGELDSINRVKVIDSFFGTQLVLKLTQ